jgi:membrane protein DedA with SNARE-associated domain/membrane-associated phospholipid phosphatase
MSSLLPSIASLGLWGYWVIGLMAFGEALVLTSVFSPGTVVVVLGGALAAQGIYDIFDMMWFVAIGTILGSQASFWLGTKGEALFGEGGAILSTAHLERGQKFFAKYGGASIVIGHFLGPLRPIAPVVAGLSGMGGRRFLMWNVAGGAAYAIAMVSVGYFFGAAFNIFGPTTTRVGLFAGVVLAILGLLWFLISRLRRGWPFAVSVLRSVGTAIRDNAEVRSLVSRHPKLFRLLAARVSPQTFRGLPATLLGLTFLYFIGLYAELALEVVGRGPIVEADTRLSNLLYAFRDDTLIRFFSIVTSLGQWRAITIMALAATALMWVWDRRAYIPALWLVLAGNQITVIVLKLIFARARSNFAVYAESSYSFPSGHSAAIAAFCIFVTYVLVRERIGRDILWVLLCTSLVFLVGLSRLYLDEHFLSDVLNGYVVGVLWAITGIFAAEHWGRVRRSAVGTSPTRPRLRWVSAGFVAVSAVALWLVVADYAQTLRLAAPRTEIQLTTSVEQALKDGVLPSRTESIIGTPQEPISIILFASDDAALLEIMTAAEWQVADRPTIRTLARAVVAAWLDRPYDTAPITPIFWNGWPQDFSLEQSVPAEGLRQRHHARFWRVPTQVAGGLQVYVGTASFDTGIKWGLTHRIAPDVDAERDRLTSDLLSTGRVQQDGWADLVAPFLGQNVVGDPFFTDGRAAVLLLP